jgi:hypothetical protein
MEEYILGWGTLALINAALANFDNRSPLAYLIGSIFLGPILTVALATTKYDPDKGTEFINIYHGRSNKPSPVTKLPNWLVAIIFFGFLALFSTAFIN